jgi:hypothetical protein
LHQFAICWSVVVVRAAAGGQLNILEMAAAAAKLLIRFLL